MDKIDSLAEVKLKSRQGGGEEKIEMQHNLDKMTARERILHLLDEGSFIEIGAMLEGNGGGVIGGYGTMNGRLSYVYSYDYTVNGGALNMQNCEKICRVMDMAAKMGAPIIGIFDSVGAKLSEGLDILGAYGKILNKSAKLSGVIPQISIVAGPTMGISALNASMSDFVIMVDNMGEMAISSCQKLIENENTYVSKEDYSDAQNCLKNGSIHISVKDDKNAVETVRELIDYIPSNNLELAPLGEEVRDVNELKDVLNDMVKNNSIDIEKVITEIADNKKVITLGGNFANTVVTKLIKLNGRSVGVIANNNINKPAIDKKACEKISRFVSVCDSFNIPILSIVDSRGFVVNIEEEKNGLAVYASKVLSALSNAEVGKISLIIGEAYGAAYLVFASKEVSFDAVYAWPSAKVSLGEPEKLIVEKYRDKIAQSDNPKETEKKIIQENIDEITDPHLAAKKGYIDDIIMPSETKVRIFAMFDMLQTKRELKYPKKHSNILI